MIVKLFVNLLNYYFLKILLKERSNIWEEVTFVSLLLATIY